MIFEYIQKLNFFDCYVNWNIEDFIVVFFLYNFIKYIIICSIVELIWPTQIFNRKNNIGLQLIRYRNFIEFILKLRNYSIYYFIYNKFFLKNLLYKKQ